MKKLFFTSLRIRKAPGFREGLNVPGFRDLSPEINIIAGPNGAGKSTAARTIMALLWPDRKKRDLDASVDFVFEGKKCSEHLGSGELKVQQDGNDRELPERPPENYSKIYMLAMHELVNNADSDLAERIVEESMGGINLDKAGQNLKYSGSLRNRGSYEYKEYRKAYENFRKTEAGQSSLEARERILTELKRKQESARQAKTEMEFLRLAGEMLTAGEELKAWDEKIKEFPEVLAKLKGDESDIIDQLELKIGQEHADIIKHKGY
jgi:energy-coupling factor transporter ATP-binding protein EcfA2